MRNKRQKSEEVIAKPSTEDALKMFGNIPTGDASMGQCKCCYITCNRCRSGNEVDISLLTTK